MYLKSFYFRTLDRVFPYTADAKPYLEADSLGELFSAALEGVTVFRG